MLEIHALADGGTATDHLVLPFEQRQRSRLRTTSQRGEVVGIFLPRGTILREGTLLSALDGRLVAVHAAEETVSTVRSADPQLLARVAYHLGNRHVAVQMGVDFVRYQADSVLDGMVRGLGADPVAELAAFEPEAGAYAHAKDAR